MGNKNKNKVAPVINSTPTVAPEAPAIETPAPATAPVVASEAEIASMKKTVIPANLAELSEDEQNAILLAVMAERAGAIQAKKEKEISALKADIARLETEIAEKKEKLKAFGVGTRGRPALTPEEKAARAAERAAKGEVDEDEAAIAQFDAEIAAKAAQAPSPAPEPSLQVESIAA